MKAGNKSRRSPRIPARHNIMLMVNGAEGETASREVVTTVHISRHGAHLIGRRRLDENTKGKVAHLGTCRQAAFRIAWQTPSTLQPGYHEMGIEFEDLSDFWEASFEDAKPVETAASPQGTRESSSTTTDAPDLSNAEVLELLRSVPATREGYEITDALWCGLVEQLEERRVITRSELIASLRRVAQQIN